MTKIEEVARAMQSSKAWPAVFGAGAATTLAIAAVTAMREPSEEMVERGNRRPYAESRFKDFASANTVGTWQAMIDEMLAEHKVALQPQK
jgi:hypothetical protein